MQCYFGFGVCIYFILYSIEAIRVYLHMNSLNIGRGLVSLTLYTYRLPMYLLCVCTRNAFKKNCIFHFQITLHAFSSCVVVCSVATMSLSVHSLSFYPSYSGSNSRKPPMIASIRFHLCRGANYYLANRIYCSRATPKPNTHHIERWQSNDQSLKGSSWIKINICSSSRHSTWFLLILSRQQQQHTHSIFRTRFLASANKHRFWWSCSIY